MLLYPLEEQFDLPTAAIKLDDGDRRQGKVVGEKDQRLGGLGILEADASQWRFEALVRVEAGENDGLIADQPGAAVDRMRVTPLDLEIRLAASYEEAAGFVKSIQAFEVEKAPIHDVERARSGNN